MGGVEKGRRGEGMGDEVEGGERERVIPVLLFLHFKPWLP